VVFEIENVLSGVFCGRNQQSITQRIFLAKKKIDECGQYGEKNE